LVVLLLLAALILAGCMPTGTVDPTNPQGGWISWNGLVSGLALALKALNDLLAGWGIRYSYGWAIILFTIFIKVITLPLTIKQLQSTKATQELQPRLAELQQKYGKDRQKLSEEQMKLYKEAGVNPLGGCLPLLIQLPILFALYRALFDLTVWPAGGLKGSGFYWIPDLAFPTQVIGIKWLETAWQAHNWLMLFQYLSLPVLMVITQVVLSKMAQPLQQPNAKQDDQQRMMGQMTLFMPLFLSYIFIGLPSGLSLYYVTTNILSVIQQYFVTGWGSLVNWIPMLAPKPARMVVASSSPESAPSDPEIDKPVKRRRRRK
jgi:YidC/Oxa1 family membrane protein insertase